MTTTPRLAPTLRLPLLLCAALAVAPAPATAAGKEPPKAWDGLERRPSKTLDHVYVRPDVTFTAYQRVRLDPIQVEFDKSWDPNAGSRNLSGRVQKSDIQKIRTGLAEGFTRVLGEALAKAGYQLAAEDDEDVLRVTASLVNVYVSAPARKTPDAIDTYVMNAGRITLFMELRDSVTGQLLARAVDTAQGSDQHQLQWSTSQSNKAAAEQPFKEWAARLVRALDTVNGKAGK